MFRKYEKTPRLPAIGFPHGNKEALTSAQIKQLLAGKVVLEEKMDGANIGIIRHKGGFHLQKRGSLVSTSEHEQFQFFHNWANVQNYDKIMALPKDTLMYGELLYAVHHIYYDHLPNYVLIFDIRHKGKFLGIESKLDFCEKYGFNHVPVVSEGFFALEEILKLVPKISKYGDRAEGIVVKKYHNKKGYMKGKIVWPDFIKEMCELNQHWSHKKLRKNKLVKSEPWFEELKKEVDEYFKISTKEQIIKDLENVYDKNRI